MESCKFKRLLSFLLALVTVLALCPATPAAQAADTDVCPCCGKAFSSISWTSCNKMALMMPSFLGGVDLTKAGHYRVTESFTMTKEYSLSAKVTIDFNGYLLQAKSGSRGFTVKNGGTLTLLNTGGNSGRLGGQLSSGDGGAVKVESGGTLNLLSGRVVGSSVSGNGGAIYNAGTVNMTGGTVEAGTAKNGGNIYNIGTLNISGGTVKGGTSSADYGGNLCNVGVLNISGGTITAGAANTYGGNIYNGNAAILTGGIVEAGTATYGGNISNAGEFYIVGGTITPADATTENDLYQHGDSAALKIYSCRYNGNMDLRPFMADCCCCIPDSTGLTIWNAGYKDGICMDCAYAVAVQEGIITPDSGTHQYEATGENTYTCTGCGKIRTVGNPVVSVNGSVYSDLAEALADAGAGATVRLLANATVTDAVVSKCTLDLNGYTLTADAFTSAASGNVIDTVGTGKLVANSVTLAENNAYVPVTKDDGIRFAQVGFEQWIESPDANTTKVKFYFAQRAKDTILDDAVKSGSTELDVQIRLTWTNASGVAQDKTYAFGQEWLQKYAEKWDSRVFVVTIAGTANISNLQCTWQVTSKAASGTTVSATTLIDPGYIQENLTWEGINSYSFKEKDMTVEEMRDLCVDFFVYSKSVLWTPNVSLDFIKNSNGAEDSMSQGTVYGGLPYISLGTGNVYRMMDYIDETTGLMDMKKALPALGTKDRLEVSDMRYFGNQCANAAFLGWGRVINSVYYNRTYHMVPANGYIFLGDVEFDRTITRWTTTYTTSAVCQDNGEQVLYAAYAQVKKADGLVYYTSAGHTIMAMEDAHVVYNSDGTINGTESYLIYAEQGQSWKDATNASGEAFQRKNGVGTKKTFKQIFDISYIPFTYQEFLGADLVEETEVSLVNGSTTLVGGTISETNRSFVATKSGPDTLSWDTLFASKITSNYAIADVYIVVTGAGGNEIYKHAVRATVTGDQELELVEEGSNVSTWNTRNLVPGRTYNVSIEVQLFTGERPVIWKGKLTK